MSLPNTEAVDDARNLDWWDLWPMAEQAQTPVAWSRSSVLFTAHGSQPLVEARLFPSGKSVVVDSPPLYDQYSAYKPPTVITISPCDGWIFAYFPHQAAGGLACMWKRAEEANRWTVTESWACSAAVVTSTWLSSSREGVFIGSPGTHVRLPLRGPATPLSEFTLLLVTQAHELHICYYKPNQPRKMLHVSLMELNPSSTLQSPSQPPTQVDTDPFIDTFSAGGVRICTHAAVGLGYGERSIVVATRSQSLPSSSRICYEITESLHQVPAFNDAPPVAWDTWSPELSLELYEVKLSITQQDYAIRVQPLPNIHYDAPLTGLNFVSTPGHYQQDKLVVKSLPGTAAMYLVASSCNLNDDGSPATSDLHLYAIQRTGPDSASRLTSELIAQRTLQSSVVSFCSGLPLNSLDLIHGEARSEVKPALPVIVAGILNTGAPHHRSSKRRREIKGEVVVLSTDLSDTPSWASSQITTDSSAQVETSLPFNVVLSPNGTAICSLNTYSLLPSQSTFYPLPRPTALRRTVSLSASLITAIRAKNIPSDIVHVLSLPNTPGEDVQATLTQAFAHFFHDDKKRVPEVLGVAVEVYKTRAARASALKEKNTYTQQWKVAHDLCSIMSNNITFGRFKVDGMFHLGIIWILISIITWSINFLEQIVKECIVNGDISRKSPLKEPKVEEDDELFGSAPVTPVTEGKLTKTLVSDSAADASSEPSPALLHLAHPFILQNLRVLLKHLKDLRGQVTSGIPSTENAKVVQDVILDLIASSGIDFAKFDTLLAEILEKAQKLDDQLLLRSLAACKIVPELYSEIAPNLLKVANSPAIDKMRLFVKPSDLVDGFSDLRIPDNRDAKIDVLTKDEIPHTLAGLSYLTCVRCGSRSKGIAFGSRASVCICGGQWVTAS